MHLCAEICLSLSECVCVNECGCVNLREGRCLNVSECICVMSVDVSICVLEGVWMCVNVYV